MLTFRDIDADNISDINCLVRWSNDLCIRHLFQSFDNQEQSQQRLGVDAPRMQRALRRSLAGGKRVQLIEWHGLVVGETSTEIDPTIVYGPKMATAWLGIVIGEERARGQGIGRRAMMHLEGFAKTLGAKHAQIGVFEFNTRARRLYKGLGYRELTSIPNTTWWKGKRWKDIRMGKPL